MTFFAKVETATEPPRGDTRAHRATTERRRERGRKRERGNTHREEGIHTCCRASQQCQHQKPPGETCSPLVPSPERDATPATKRAHRRLPLLLLLPAVTTVDVVRVTKVRPRVCEIPLDRAESGERNTNFRQGEGRWNVCHFGSLERGCKRRRFTRRFVVFGSLLARFSRA